MLRKGKRNHFLKEEKGGLLLILLILKRILLDKVMQLKEKSSFANSLKIVLLLANLGVKLFA